MLASNSRCKHSFEQLALECSGSLGEINELAIAVACKAVHIVIERHVIWVELSNVISGCG